MVRALYDEAHESQDLYSTWTNTQKREEIFIFFTISTFSYSIFFLFLKKMNEVSFDAGKNTTTYRNCEYCAHTTTTWLTAREDAMREKKKYQAIFSSKRNGELQGAFSILFLSYLKFVLVAPCVWIQGKARHSPCWNEIILGYFR